MTRLELMEYWLSKEDYNRWLEDIKLIYPGALIEPSSYPYLGHTGDSVFNKSLVAALIGLLDRTELALRPKWVSIQAQIHKGTYKKENWYDKYISG